ncbi:MAG: amino acid adenylation domain-containing protein, partial [Arcobacter sp.]|nr:amino acid adenylation domain-containing protein [Arcobacter sp.]
MIGLLAILKSGAAYVPVDPSYPKDRIEYMLEDSKATLLLTQEELKDTLTNINSEIICIDTLDVSSNSSENLNVTMSSKNLAYVIYTSGSTGFPKGVLIEHEGAYRIIKSQNYINITNKDTIFQLSNFAFDGSIFDIFASFSNGAKLLLIKDTSDLDAMEKIVNQNKNIIFFITTALFNSIVDNKINILSGIKTILFGGQEISVSHTRRALKTKVNLIHVYGPTESTVFSTYFNIKDIDLCQNTIPIGKPINNTQTYILDKNNNLVPKGVIGELHIAGDGLARGYLNKEELTSEKFINNPFDKDSNSKMYKTGDLVKYLEDGNIEYLGRIDDQ